MNGKPLKVLLVEDNVVSAQLTRTILTRAETSSFEVRTAETLMGALDLLGAGAFDVILLDVSLPDSDGLGTLGYYSSPCSSGSRPGVDGIRQRRAGEFRLATRRTGFYRKRSIRRQWPRSRTSLRGNRLQAGDGASW